MKCNIEFSQEASSDIDKLFYADKKLFARILNKIKSLESHPLEGKALVGNHKGEFSLRVGTFRIVYEIDHSAGHIYILTIKHRKHVY